MVVLVGVISEIELFIVWMLFGVIGLMWYLVGRIYNVGDLFVGGNIILGILMFSMIGLVYVVFNVVF